MKMENLEQSKSMSNRAIRNGIYGYLGDYLLKIVSVTEGYEFSIHNRDLIDYQYKQMLQSEPITFEPWQSIEGFASLLMV